MKVAVVGTGYVGLVTGACLAEVGHEVVCHDTDADRVAALAAGQCPIHEDGLGALLQRNVAAGRLGATGKLADAMTGARVVMIAVGTPSEEGRIDLSAIKRASADIGAALAGRRDYPVVVVKSTVVPGTTETLVRGELERASGLTAGSGFGLVMNPEYLSQGRAVKDFMEPDRIVIGAIDDASAQAMTELYASFRCPKIVTAIVNAELAKYAANALQATLISFSNQIASLCEKIPGADEAQVMATVHHDRNLTLRDGNETKRAPVVGFLRGGVGFGGSCFPKDLLAIRHFARGIGAPTAMIDAAISTNTARPAQIVDLLEAELGGLAGRRIAVLGLAFKPGTDDLRFSPGVALAARLQARGARVSTHDPLVLARDHARTVLEPGIVINATAQEALSGADAAIIATAWPVYAELDWAWLGSVMRRPLLLDGRDIFADGAPPPRPIIYRRIGTGPRPPMPLGSEA